MLVPSWLLGALRDSGYCIPVILYGPCQRIGPWLSGQVQFGGVWCISSATIGIAYPVRAHARPLVAGRSMLRGPRLLVGAFVFPWPMLWVRDTLLAMLCLCVILGAALGFAELLGHLLT